jgi:hypothetical protein
LIIFNSYKVRFGDESQSSRSWPNERRCFKFEYSVRRYFHWSKIKLTSPNLIHPKTIYRHKCHFGLESQSRRPSLNEQWCFNIECQIGRYINYLNIKFNDLEIIFRKLFTEANAILETKATQVELANTNSDVSDLRDKLSGS